MVSPRLNKRKYWFHWPGWIKISPRWNKRQKTDSIGQAGQANGQEKHNALWAGYLLRLFTIRFMPSFINGTFQFRFFEKIFYGN